MWGRLCSASFRVYRSISYRRRVGLGARALVEGHFRLYDRYRERLVYTLAESCTEISRSGARCGLRGHTETLLPNRTGPVVDTDTF